VQPIALPTLNDQGAPAYDHHVAAAFAEPGVPAFACTPDRFPDLMSAAIRRRELTRWVSADESSALNRADI
jgi:hypothetical protein